MCYEELGFSEVVSCGSLFAAWSGLPLVISDDVGIMQYVASLLTMNARHACAFMHQTSIQS